MSENIDPEEALALQEPIEASAAAASVADRDFRRPMRLSREQLSALSSALVAGLTPLDGFVRGFLGESASCAIDEVSEESAENLVRSLEPPLAVGRFSVANQPAWIVWRTSSALASIGALLGDTKDEGERPLSNVERRLLHGFFAGLIDPILTVFQLEGSDLHLVREPYEVGSWRDGDAAHADSHRLCVGLALEGAIARSVVRIYLPGFQPAGSIEPKSKAGLALPSHLSSVEVAVRAVLGHSDVPLADLMSLEEGDVIPLDGESGSVELTVEDQTCARGRLGQRNGKYALRVDEILKLPLLAEDQS